MTRTEPHRLCALDSLEDPGSRGFVLQTGGAPLDLFVVRRGAAVHAYINRCPHAGSPLDWLPDQFLSHDGVHIQCATHDALFRIEDGVCLAGPCVGDRLTPVPVWIEDGQVTVDLRAE